MSTLKIQSYQHPEWLTNTYLVTDPASQSALLIDAGVPVRLFKKAITSAGVELKGILITHSHFDHIDQLPEWSVKCQVNVYGHSLGASALGGTLTSPLQGGEELIFGGIKVRVISTPGHSTDHLSFLVNDHYLFSGDLLFKGSVGGSQYGNFRSLKSSLMDTIMKLPPDTVVYPGHSGPSTIGVEWEKNPFILAFRGLSKEENIPCTYKGAAGIIRLTGTDYDGDKKYLVEFPTKKEILPADAIQLS